jgi:cardiolipin synthase C
MPSKFAARVLIALCLSSGLMACSSLPSLDGREESTMVTDTAGTRLGRAVTPLANAHPGQSGIRALPDAHEAFAARVLLAHVAERTLDIQYYMWRKDTSGTLLLEAVREAADRGVRVRLLLDDNNTAGLDATLTALHAHPNIEVRLFNPFLFRGSRVIGYLTDFSRLNRRMHNKSFTADNQATIIGGRNIGDEYFGATEGQLFIDVDVLAVGQVVSDVSTDFDRYWSSGSAYPLQLVVPPPTEPGAMDFSTSSMANAEQGPVAAAYPKAVRDTPLVRELVERQLALEWAPTRMVSDDPAKALGMGEPQTVMPQLKNIIGDPAREFQLITAYFVPGETGVEALVAMAGRGVAVSVLTNSQEATDVAAVHAGYAKRRKPLLKGGVKLYELRRLSPPLEGRKGYGNSMTQSSGSSLHAKTFAVDRSQVFIGSFNFDQRSLNLNTEMGFLIHSPALAGRIASTFERGVVDHAYEVRLDEEGRLYWLETRDGQKVRHDLEPGASFWRRAAVWFFSLLPIEWLL